MKRMKNYFVSTAAVAVAAVIGLSGCGQKSENAISEKAAASYPLPDPPLVADGNPGIPGGRFVMALYGDPKTYNPITANEQSSEDIYQHLFAALLGFDWPTQAVTPGLADSWTNSPDGKTWTFHLRKNLRWSDGMPLTADDVVFTCNDFIYNTNIQHRHGATLIRVNGKNFHGDQNGRSDDPSRNAGSLMRRSWKISARA